MERPKIKAINFDLDTKLMRQAGVYPNGYDKVKKAMAKIGFEHRQGSGYVSKSKITSKDVLKAVRRLQKDVPWLQNCVNKFDVTDVGKQDDLTQIIKNTKVNHSSQNQSPQLQAMKANLPKQAHNSALEHSSGNGFSMG